MRDTSLSPIYCTSPDIHTSNAHIISVISWYLRVFRVVQLTNALMIDSQTATKWPTATEPTSLPFWATINLMPSLLPPNFYWNFSQIWVVLAIFRGKLGNPLQKNLHWHASHLPAIPLSVQNEIKCSSADQKFKTTAFKSHVWIQYHFPSVIHTVMLSWWQRQKKNFLSLKAVELLSCISKASHSVP